MSDEKMTLSRGEKTLERLVLNLGGEGEIPGAINQQTRRVLKPGWPMSRTGETIEKLAMLGPLLVCENSPLPFPDKSVDCVYTNGVPVDVDTFWGQGYQSREIWRILKAGGQWIDNGILRKQGQS